MKKLSLYLILFVVLSSFVLAANLDVTVKSVKGVISTDEEAVFELEVLNKFSSDDFKAYYNGLEWYITPVSFSLDKSKTQTITVKAKPLYVSVGQYSVPLKIKGRKTGDVTDVNLNINIKDDLSNEYLPTIAVKIDLPAQMYPNETLDISMNLKNRNPLELNNISVIIESDYFSKTNTISLKATDADEVAEDNIFNSFELDTKVPPQKMNVNFKIIVNDREVYQSNRGVEIIQYSPPFDIEESVDKSFFKSLTTYAVTNNGNVKRTEAHKVKISLFRQLFTSQIPESSLLKEEGNRYLMWTVTLNPGETTEYKAITNYRTFLLGLFIIALVILFYFMLRSPLTIKKTAKVLKLEEGGISMLQVMLTLRNISGSKINNVSIKDAVPNLADYLKEEHIGSMAPSKVIRHDRKGTTLVWDIADFDSFEERIISYKIKTRLNVLGGLSLKGATGRFKTNKGKNRVTKSTMLRLVLNKKDQ